VSRDSICLSFLIAALNNIDIMSCDLENAYLNAPCREKIWFEGWLECGKDQAKVCVIVHSLYGLKSTGAAFWSSLAQILRDLGYESSRADPDMWMQKAVRDDGHQYFKMLLFMSMIFWLSATKQKMQLGQRRKHKATQDLSRHKHIKDAITRWLQSMVDFTQIICQEFYSHG
jgi:hypothetical protein